MSKKILATNYSISEDSNKITVKGFYRSEQFQLITDVTPNTGGNILYNFADLNLGHVDVTFDEIKEETTIQLEASFSAYGVDSTSKLQIIVDHPEVEMEVSDSLLDPVHKIRVSTPENLIDTDFEYGLQPTKWETLELSNNVPSFFVADGDTSLDIVDTITSISGSDLVKVSCTDQHNLVVGTPVDVSGLDFRTAEGKFLIVSADSNNFYYRANAPLPRTGEIGSIYTAITPGSFYAGSQIPYSGDGGLVTDELEPSTLSVQTPDVHGFVENSQFYLVNTIASKSVKATDNKTAPDGEPAIDKRDTFTTTLNLDLAKTKTNALRGRHSTYFNNSSIDIVTGNITWPNHQLQNNYCLIYVPPAGAPGIGGLSRFEIYYVKVVDSNTIQLTASQNGSAIIFTSPGDDSVAQHSLHLVYEIRYSSGRYRDSYTYHYTWAQQFGNGSGNDMRVANSDPNTGATFYGLGARKHDGLMFMTRNYAYPGNNTRWASYYIPEYQNSRNIYGNNHHFYTDFPEYDNLTPTNHPSRWNPIEDFGRWQGYNWTGYTNEYSMYFRFQKYYYHGTYNYSWSSRRMFVFPFIYDEEADTFFAQDHGLEDGGSISFATKSGAAPTINVGTSFADTRVNQDLADGDYAVEVVSKDRIRLSGQRIQTAVGDSNGAYELNAIISNKNANSIYIPQHGLIQDQEVTFTTVGSPIVPTVPSGPVSPKWKLNSQGNAPFIASLINDALTTHMSEHPDFATNHQNFRTSNHSGNSTRLVDGSTAGISGLQPIDYVNTQYSSNNLTVVQNGTRVYGASTTNYSDFNVGNFNLTTPKNLFASNSANIYGIFRLATPWQQYTSIPFYMDLTFGSDAAHGNKSDGTFTSNSYWRFYNYTFMDHYTSYTYPTYTGSNYDGTITGSTSGHQYSYDASWTTVERNWAFTQMIVTFGKTTSGQGWSGYVGGFDTYQYNSNSRNSFSYVYDQSLKQDEITMRLFFAGDTSLNFASAKVQNLMNAIIQKIDAEFVNPTFANNDVLTVNVIDNNRFSLSNNNALVDFIDSGDNIDSANFFKFTLSDVQGAADGSYKAESVGENLINLSAPFQIEGNEETIDADNIDSAALPIVGGHNFLSGTKVTYTNGSDSALAFLTDGGEYYVHAIDDQYIQLHEDIEDALVGINPLPITADSAEAQHNLRSLSIAGRTKVEGLVSLSEGSKKITGTQTLFKRFFKSGDAIFFKNDSSTPGFLEENEVAVISDDENMELVNPIGFSHPGAEHFVKTNIYAKPDGYSVHRPFDGGVEIGAGLAPLSQITRQTRKYFRYQSGKGIQTSLAINFNPPVIMETVSANGTLVTSTTKYPHNLSTGMSITVSGASDENYNGPQQIDAVIDDYTFTYIAPAAPNASVPSGIVQYIVDGYSGSYTRSGMFDNQNGFFFEYDGNTLWCVRRSSTTQLSGTVRATKGSGLIEGLNTNFAGQLNKNDKVVIRGQTYKVVKIANRTSMYVQPQYRGITTDGIIVTKTIDVRVPQDQWNIDRCDGTGKEGFVLNTSKIQMAYMDYSWYGAGKIRFGFKDRKGHVRYVHEFIHNNRLDEAYMRSGNLPAKYEVENDENPTYAPTLFHWGTSVIMDGTFDNDAAYLFTAPSKNLSFTNGQALTATTTQPSELRREYNRSKRTYDWYVRLTFNTADASKFSTGTKLYETTNLTGEEVAYTDYGDGGFRVYIYIESGWRTPGLYPNVDTAQVVNIGQPATGGDDIQLGTDIIPLVSLRLAPSVDNNLTGNLGERDIINRMQLKLAEVGLILTHDCEVKLILNGDISTVTWENVKSPSLSQLIKHEQGDQVTGGNEVFSFRASGGANGTANASNFSLGDLIDLGNSILGGDGIFPNGPDILTVAIQVVDTSSINADQPFGASSRITWAESQA